MPAKTKTGFKYLPVYHDLFSSKKIRDAEDIIDPTGEDLLARILVDKFLLRVYSAIFRVGYFLFWDDEAKQKLCAEIGNGVTIIKLDRYINAFFGANLLNRDIYDKHSILTNKGIQEEWLNISISYFRRKNAYIISEYSLIYSEDIADSSEQSIRSLGKKDTSLGKITKKSKKKVKAVIEKVDCSEESAISSEEMADSSEPMPINAEEAFNNISILNKGIGNKGNTEGIMNFINDDDEKGFSEESRDSSEQSGDMLGRIDRFLRKNENSAPEPLISSEKPPDCSEESIHSSKKTTNVPKKEIPDVHGPGINSFHPIEHLLEVYFTSNTYSRTRELLAMKSHIDEMILRDWGDAFNRHLISEGVTIKQKDDWPRHFKNWFRFQDFKNVNPKILFTEKDTQNERPKNKPSEPGANIKGHQPINTQSIIGKINKLSL